MTSERNQHHDLTVEEKERLSAGSKLTEFQRQKLDKDSKKNWDLFYKRNGDRFFKNRYWTRNEFHEIYQTNRADVSSTRYLLEVGCGCGDFILPFLEDNNQSGCDKDRRQPDGLFIYCCDVSDQAINILKENAVYKKNHPFKVKAFVADLTDDKVDLTQELDGKQMDLVSLIFVLSAVDPRNMKAFVDRVYGVLEPGGLVLFRDYAIYDRAMLRFAQSSKICDQFYVRQDGTRAYFFSKEELSELFQGSGFTTDTIEYVRRETINNATKEAFSRIFLQAKFRKGPQ